MIDALKLLPPEPEPSLKMGLMSLGEIDPEAVALEVAPTEPITLQQAKDHLRVYTADEDSYISALIVAARQMAEGRLNRTITPRVLHATFDTWGTALRLLKPPVLAVEEIAYTDATGELQVLTGGYLVHLGSDSPRITLGFGSTWPALQPREGAVTVRYRAGYAPGTVPYPIVQWMLLAIGTMYGNRETLINGVASSPLAGGFVDALLQPYMVYE